MAKVCINFVTWNGIRFLPSALASLYAQTFQDFEIIIVDNGSTDGTVEYLKTHYPQITLLKNFKNLGFSRGYNQTIHLALGKWPKENLAEHFILITNQDIILEPDFLAKLMDATKGRNRVATFGGKLRRAYFKSSEDDFEEMVKSNVIDTTGLVVKRSKRVYDRGAGEEDRGQYDEAGEVFGLSGAIMLARASALADVRYRDEFFDEDFFAYKEDIDLAWRLRLRGWSSFYEPSAVAYHFRGAGAPAKASLRQTIKARRARPFFVKYHSLANHYLLLTKNLFVRDFFKDLPWILFYEKKKAIYALFFEPRVLGRAIGEFFGKLKNILRKRKYNFSRLAIKNKDLRNWIR
jgi:GT2 family glycosyltransferase